MSIQFGSFINSVQANGTVKEIIPGETPATLLFWSDRSPATVVETFKKGKYEYVVVQEDDYERTDSLGISDSQSYDYKRNPNGNKITFRITPKGFQHVYVNEETGRFINGSGHLTIGRREKYHDFSF
jgi:hypothetical protein